MKDFKKSEKCEKTEKSEKCQVVLYTDGAASGNPGPGGYGAILVYKNIRKELSGGFRHTTNNRMELMAVIVGLRALKKPCVVRVVSDSQYVVNAIEKGWLKGWEQKNWRTSNRKPVKNIDLWKQLGELLKIHEVRFQWIQGHAGHPENERCDHLAVAAYQQPNLPEDPAFEYLMDIED